MLKKITPVGNFVLIQPLEKIEEQKSEEGIILPMSDQIEYGTVMEVSKDLTDVYSKGGMVIYDKDSGIAQPYKFKACYWVNSINIKARVEEETN